MGGGHSTQLSGNQSSQTNVGRATDSCSALIGANQCGILMDVLGCLATYVIFVWDDWGGEGCFPAQ